MNVAPPCGVVAFQPGGSARVKLVPRISCASLLGAACVAVASAAGVAGACAAPWAGVGGTAARSLGGAEGAPQLWIRISPPATAARAIGKLA